MARQVMPDWNSPENWYTWDKEYHSYWQCQPDGLVYPPGSQHGGTSAASASGQDALSNTESESSSNEGASLDKIEKFEVSSEYS